MIMSNAVLEALKNRRSIRRYKPGLIEDEKLQAILEAGTYAPTAKGLQSPVMVVVKDPSVIKDLSQMNAAVMGTSGDPFYGASELVVVLADTNIGPYEDDGALVMGNLMLAAHSLGVGSCWINRAKEMFKTDKGKEYLAKWGLGNNYEGIGICILGYADGDAPKPKDRKKDYIIYD